jgi:hypothetical protein
MPTGADGNNPAWFPISRKKIGGELDLLGWVA